MRTGAKWSTANAWGFPGEDDNILELIVIAAQHSYTTKTTKLYTLHGWTVHYGNYISMKLFQMYFLSQWNLLIHMPRWANSYSMQPMRLMNL